MNDDGGAAAGELLESLFPVGKLISLPLLSTDTILEHEVRLAAPPFRLARPSCASASVILLLIMRSPLSCVLSRTGQHSFQQRAATRSAATGGDAAAARSGYVCGHSHRRKLEPTAVGRVLFGFRSRPRERVCVRLRSAHAWGREGENSQILKLYAIVLSSLH